LQGAKKVFNKQVTLPQQRFFDNSSSLLSTSKVTDLEKMKFAPKILILIAIAAVTRAFQSQLNSRAIGAFSVARRNIGSTTQLFADEDSISGNTVVSRCTKKINESLNPTECTVTSTDSDPNGSHVRAFTLNLNCTTTFL
jgi:hypothetical protein